MWRPIEDEELMRRDPGMRRRLVWAGLSSLAIHALVALPVFRWITTPPETRPPLAQRAEPTRAVPILSEEEVDRLIALAEKRPKPPPPPPLPPEPPKPQSPDKVDKQVVEIPPPENPTRPEDAKYYAEYDSKVDRQTVSANKQAPTPEVMQSDLTKLGHGAKVDGASRQRPDDLPKDQQKTREARADRAGDAANPGERPGPEAPPRPDAAEAAARKDRPDRAQRPVGEGPFKAPEPKVADGQPAGGGGRVGGAAAPDDYRDLLPSLGPEALTRKDGSIDHLPDVEDGKATFLDTMEYKHAWFFNRVKRGVQQRWRAVEAHRRYDPHGRIYGVRDRLTVVEVTLNPDGSLDDIYVTKDSGVAFLDDAALQAFREAQPFPNPPDALRGEDGRIRFRFSFFLEINGRGMRMFRSQ